MARPTAQESRERDRKAFLLRAGGATFDRIADELGFSNRGAAHKAWRRAAQRLDVEPTEDQLALRLGRLEALHRALWPAAMRGDVSAVDRILKLEERAERLLQAAGTGPAAGDGSGGEVVPPNRLAELRERHARGVGS